MGKFTTMGIAAAMLVAGATTMKAQDKVEASVGVDFVSQYVWRGQDLGDFSIQPGLGLSWKGLSLSAWGSVGINDGAGTELDLTLAYSVGGFNIGITDYWFDNTGKDGRYLYYDAHSTAHVFEANVGYDFGPVALQWFTNFAGDDMKVGDDGELKHAYSSYVEVSAPFKLGGMDWVAAVGAVPFESSAVYGDVENFAVTNVSVKATKDLHITPSFTVPVFAQAGVNPHSQLGYFVVGFSIQP